MTEGFRSYGLRQCSGAFLPIVWPQARSVEQNSSLEERVLGRHVTGVVLYCGERRKND